MGCSICGNEGDQIEEWDEDGKTYLGFYCETCSRVYYESYDSSKQTIRDETDE